MLDRNELHKLASVLGGLPVLGCRPGSPAQQAGVRYGDIVMSVNGIRTPDWQAFMTARNACKTNMLVEVFRDGAHITFDVSLDPNATAASVDMPALLAELIADHVVPIGAPSAAPKAKAWN